MSPCRASTRQPLPPPAATPSRGRVQCRAQTMSAPHQAPWHAPDAAHRGEADPQTGRVLLSGPNWRLGGGCRFSARVDDVMPVARSWGCVVRPSTAAHSPQGPQAASGVLAPDGSTLMPRSTASVNGMKAWVTRTLVQCDCHAGMQGADNADIAAGL
jgi:hypothetical protein